MLILGRRAGESLVIGDRISVTILSVEPGGSVTLGIDAPRDLLILRKELQQAASTNQEAASADASTQMLTALENAFLHPAAGKKPEKGG